MCVEETISCDDYAHGVVGSSQSTFILIFSPSLSFVIFKVAIMTIIYSKVSSYERVRL